MQTLMAWQRHGPKQPRKLPRQLPASALRTSHQQAAIPTQLLLIVSDSRNLIWPATTAAPAAAVAASFRSSHLRAFLPALSAVRRCLSIQMSIVSASRIALDSAKEQHKGRNWAFSPPARASMATSKWTLAQTFTTSLNHATIAVLAVVLGLVVRHADVMTV